VPFFVTSIALDIVALTIIILLPALGAHGIFRGGAVLKKPTGTTKDEAILDCICHCLPIDAHRHMCLTQRLVRCFGIRGYVNSNHGLSWALSRFWVACVSCDSSARSHAQYHTRTHATMREYMDSRYNTREHTRSQTHDIHRNQNLTACATCCWLW